MTVERIPRWDVALVPAVALAGIGVVLGDPVLLVAAVVPLTYVAIGALDRLPGEPSLSVERTVSESSPAPGDRVTVRLTVRNVGETTASDVRVVDGVPDGLTVVDGSPRASLALRPGSEGTVEYTLVARRGDHAFEEPLVGLRTMTATGRRTDRIVVEGTTMVDCRTDVSELPLRRATTLRAGGLATDVPGAGVEFYATREYRPTDPITRIDWRRFARLGDLTTVQYRTQRAARVLLVVDARESARVVPRPGYPDGVELCAYAARQAFGALADAGHNAGLAGVGVDGDAVDAVVPTTGSGLPWVPIGSGPETAARVEAVLDAACRTDGSRNTVADGGSRLADRIVGSLTADTDVLLVTPATDDDPLSLVRRLRAEGYGTSVISPDPTEATGGTAGGAVAALRRRTRLSRLRDTGATVVDWTPAEPLETALSTALRRLL